ncbi:hypothetical protein C2I18_27755 [Paenibacillus sp. PK3_47]|uniref:GNAT family N-acetyltransferase n=1 Tax=Paenibacillus sp. PK3_47 TaxID=2072642 RepID=UPI00201DEF89|nr:GNAT family N-acetyltransferase [Paenibacillus sp. PK3_47]UQZ36995.1 hypothetical protein C2I18_27755 [Paenibacillus sp. PK3_47]
MPGRLTLSVFRRTIPAEFGALLPPQMLPVPSPLPDSLIVFGAYADGVPAGLGAVSLSTAGGRAKVLGVTVDSEYRRQGIGRRLMSELGRAVRRNGASSLFTEYIAGTETESAEAEYLTSCGFSPPRPGIYICSGPFQAALQLDWASRLSLPEDFILDSFTTLTDDERSNLNLGEGDWYPAELHPFAEEEFIDYERSLIMRHRNRIAGWMIVEAFGERKMLLKTMFVSKPYQRMARGAALGREMLLRLSADPQFDQGILFVEAYNTPMVSFLKRHLVHPDLKLEVLWRTEKVLRA